MYWLVSLQTPAPETAWSRLQELSTYTNDYSVNFRFAIPETFRVGTLDSLLALSDELGKVNQAVEGTVNKIRRQLLELQAGVAPEDRADVWVEGMPPEGYLQRFTWNEAKYPSRRQLKDTVAAVMDTTQKLDDDLKVCVWVGGGRGARGNDARRRAPTQARPGSPPPPPPHPTPTTARRCASPSTASSRRRWRRPTGGRGGRWRCATSPRSCPPAHWWRLRTSPPCWWWSQRLHAPIGQR